jgi:hypothetical protein
MANSIPTLSGLDAVAFLESAVNQTPQLLAPTVTFTDSDGDFSGGTVTVSGLLSEDIVSIRNQGTGASEIGFANGFITYGGTIVGFAAGGMGGTLHISFLPGATPAAVDALLQNLTYANTSNTPTVSRTLEISISDAAGAAVQAPLSFTQRTGAANPFDAIDWGFQTAPTFADIDGDGDLDAFVGKFDQTLSYLENIGTATAPEFASSVLNPFGLAGIAAGTGTRTPTFADIDGDGDLDAIVGQSNGEVYFYRNTGSASAPNFTQLTGVSNPFSSINVSVGAHSKLSFADIDSDGDLDFFTGEQDGFVNYFENTGSATVLAFTQRFGSDNPFTAEVGDYSAPHFADVDGDGDLDAVLGSHAGTLRYFENVGTREVARFAERTGSANPWNGINVGGHSTPTLADIDGDGDLDTIAGEYDGVLNYFENTTSPPTARRFVAVTGVADPFAGIDIGGDSAPAFMDVDGDGDLDAFVGENGGIINYFTNVGSAIAPSFVQRTGLSNPLNLATSPVSFRPSFVDMDGDGDLDAIAGITGGGLSYFKQLGSATFSNFAGGASNPFITFPGRTFDAPAFADLDNDGDADAVFGDSDGTLYFLKNTGNANAPVFSEQTLAANPFAGVDVGDSSTPAFADIDRDGDFDLVVGSIDGTLSYFENTGTATTPSFAQRSGTANPFAGIDVGSRSTPTFADIDGDGDADLIVGNGDGTLSYFRNIASGFSVGVNVTADDDLAVANDDAFAITETATATGNVFLDNGSGLDSDPDSVRAVTAVNGSAIAVGTEIILPSGALLMLNADGTFHYDPNGEFEYLHAPGFGAVHTSATDTFTYTLNGSDTGTVTLTITGVDFIQGATMANSVPTLSGLDAATLLENTVNAAPQLLDADVSLRDLDGSLSGGTLAISGLLAEDLVSIRNQGTGAGQIGFANGVVTLGGVAFGVAGGGDGRTLTVAFLAGTTVPMVEALLENLTYANNSNVPTATRTLAISIVDGAGASAIAAPDYAARSDTANPFAGFDVGANATTSVADIDTDGDLDLVVGEQNGLLHFFENTGTSTSPQYVKRIDAANPFNGLIGSASMVAAKPAFGDSDNDGDIDVMVGYGSGSYVLLRNDGSSTNPSYSLIHGASVAPTAAPGFADLDGDGDDDLIFGQGDGTFRYFERNGPFITERTGSLNPFNGIDVASGVVPTFGDVDADGDVDMVLGHSGDSLLFFENIGTANAPAFVQRTGINNPFGAIATSTKAAPSLGDVDGDGDLDAVFGRPDGTLGYIENTAPRALDLTVNVTASNDAGIARNDAISTTETAPVTGNVFANNGSGADSDPDSTLAVTTINGSVGSVGAQITLPSGALLRLNANGTFTYNPNGAFNVAPAGSGAPNLTATDSFTYTLAGGGTATVRMTIAGVDAADKLVGTSAVDLLSGLNFNDQLFGLGGNDRLSGGVGDDILDGGAGVDLLEGGAGNDIYVMSNSADFVVDSSGTDTITSTIGRSLANYPGVEHLTLLGSSSVNGFGSASANMLVGNAGKNVLSGMAGNDTINGGAGDDIIVGGRGKDALTGGAGRDRFDFNEPAESGRAAASRDVIKDFAHGSDRIDLATIDANGSAASNGRFVFVAVEGKAFSGVRGELKWDRQDSSGTTNDRTIVSGDLNGDRIADFTIELSGLKRLDAGDFLL